MSGYFAKLIVIFVIAAVGAGVHLGSSWPVKLKAEPDQPPPRTLTVPGASQPATPDPGDARPAEPADQAADSAAEQSTDEGPSAGDAPQQIVLDRLEIDLDTTRALYENRLATFVDARPGAEFEAGHIDGAIHISPSMLDDANLMQLDFIDPTLPIVIYCGGGDCDDSHRVAELLQDLRGFEQTHVFVDGFPAWEAAGLPTATGPDPLAE